MKDLAPKEGQTTAVLGSSGSPNVAEVLHAAAAELERVGWFPADGKNAPCVAVAIANNAKDLFQAEDAREAFAASIGLPDSLMTGIFVWNDNQPDRETVVAALRAAASKQPEQVEGRTDSTTGPGSST